MKVKSESESEVAQYVRLFATPWAAAFQAPPSMGFSRQEYWSGVPLPFFSFHVLAIVNSAAVNTGVHVSFSVLIFSGCMHRSGISGSYGGFIPTF